MTLEMWGDSDGDRGQFKKPVITKVHSLGPAHKARISSSQKSIAINGPFVIPYLLDVKTIIGAAYRGKFHPVEKASEVEELARQAYLDGEPLLLEIELWSRTNPRDHNTSLELEGTAFFKLMPARPAIPRSDEVINKTLSRGVSRPPFEISRRHVTYRNI